MRRLPAQVMMVLGGWAAMAVALRLGMTRVTAPNHQWALRTLGVAALVMVVMTIVVVDAVRGWRRGPVRFHPLDAIWMLAGVCVWLLGGLIDVLLGLLDGDDSCSGTGGSSFECLHRAGPGLQALGGLMVLLATVVVAAMFWVGRRSRVAGWLAPALIVGLYALAVVIWEPHAGFGIPTRHVSV